MAKMLGASHWWGSCACRQCRNGRGNKKEQTVYKRAQRGREKTETRREVSSAVTDSQ
jgi:hypothetical protein